MSKTLEKTILIILDWLTINAGFFLWCELRHHFGLFTETSFGDIFRLSMIIYIFWLILFLFFGMYRIYFTKSRTDEIIDVIKIISIGVFVIFILTLDLRQDFSRPLNMSRFLILSYWLIMVVLISTGRILIRTLHRRLLEAGIGRRRALIVGWGKKAWELHDHLLDAPALGYEVVGFLHHENRAAKRKTHKGIPLQGTVNQLFTKIYRDNIQDVLIAFPRRSEKKLKEVISQCDGTPVGIKIVPELYDVIIGQVRTNQIYGFPLIEILPQLISPWEAVVKRVGDFLLAVFVVAGLLPFWLFLALAIRIDSRGPVFYTQKRVGKDGRIFSVIKFRSMVVGAEKMTGPVWASDNDSRITAVGRFMRKTRLDEIPQFINILRGEMSLVGPRPERPFFVDKLKKALPLYNRRLRIQPGITGWAQVKGDYDQSLENVKQKLEYDLFYIENMSLRMDIKIILHTVYVMLCGKGQ